MEILHSKSSACRFSNHLALAKDWHLGQWRSAHVMVSSPLRVLWGVIPYGELNAVTGAKATTRIPFFSPLSTWSCQRPAAPLGRNYSHPMPPFITSHFL